MDKLLRVVGIIVAALIAFWVVGLVIGFVIKTVVFLVLAVGAVYLIASVSGRNRISGSSRRRSLRNFR